MPCWLMTESLDQHLETIELGIGMLDNNAILGQETIVGFLFFGQRMITPSLERQIEFRVGVVFTNAIIALVHHSGFAFGKFGKQVCLAQQSQVVIGAARNAF